MALRTALLILLAATIAVAGPHTVEGPDEAARIVRRRLPGLSQEVARALGFEYEGQIAVRLAASDREFRAEVGDRHRRAAGVAYPRDARIVIRLPATGARSGVSLVAVLRHELVHVMLPPRLSWRAGLPLWFEEGLAQVVGARVNRSDLHRLPIAAAAGSLIPLSELRSSFPEDPSRSALAYAEGESVVEYILSQHGIAALHRLLDAVGKSGSFEAALESELGLSPADLEAGWKGWVHREEEAWWLAILRLAFLPFLLFVASLLAVAASVRLRRRRRREYESLPE